MLKLAIECEDREDETLCQQQVKQPLHAFSLAPNTMPGEFISKMRQEGHSKLLSFNKGTTTLAFRTKDAIYVACDSRASQGSYIADQTVRKIIHINRYLLGTMAGGAADCSFWERYLTMLVKLEELRNEEPVSVAHASKMLAAIFYQYKGYGLSCGTMVSGYDRKHKKLEIYYVDDSGERILGDVFSVGSGSVFAYGVLDSGYSMDLTQEQAHDLARRSIYHAGHRDAASGGVCRVYMINEKGWQVLSDEEDISEMHYKFAAEKGVDPKIL